MMSRLSEPSHVQEPPKKEPSLNGRQLRQWQNVNEVEGKPLDNRSSAINANASSGDASSRERLEKKFSVAVVGDTSYSGHLDGRGSEIARRGYAINVRPVLEVVTPHDSDKPQKRSGLCLYFVDEYGETFRVTQHFSPYFYIKLASEIAGVDTTDWDQRRHQIVQLLESVAADRCRENVEVRIVEKIDLSHPGHIQLPESGIIYRPRDLIKISFLNVEDASALRREMAARVTRNRSIASQLNETFRHATGLHSGTGGCGGATTATAREVYARMDDDPFLWIDDIFEWDVGLVSRFCIDSHIRCGKWYSVRKGYGDTVEILCCPEEMQSVAPPLRYLAWDIEVTKDPLKFPSAAKDSITLISYMCDGQGFLIVNREFLVQDIPDFEYTPKPEYPGKFQVFNVANEKAVILKFFEHIRDLRPHILVTYNGDNFDFEFVRLRCQLYGISMLEAIGFPYATRDGIPPLNPGEPTNVRTAMGVKQEYQGCVHVHMDCLHWVERDSYLPCGSRGLKAVTRAKLGYDPRELDPELMTRYAAEQPRLLAEYSVSDAVATYYLYAKYIHNFTFALASIIPLPPDDILRKGSGTLCEHLLMAEAFLANVLFPNKHQEVLEKWRGDRLLVNETYVGGSVAQLNSGIFRNDLPEEFHVNPLTYQELIDGVDEVLDQWFTREDGQGIEKENVKNLDCVRRDLIERLTFYRDTPRLCEEPTIYHFDVGAMYPNIILSNRLQPTSIVSENHCQQCPFYSMRTACQKPMRWQWKGDEFPLSRGQIEFVKDQLVHEAFLSVDSGPPSLRRGKVNGREDDEGSGQTDDDEDIDNGNDNPGVLRGSMAHEEKQAFRGAGLQRSTPPDVKSWKDLTEKQQHEKLFERLKLISRKQSRKFKISVEEERVSTVCMRENPFYVQTVRDFRDRRYIFKVKKREAENKLVTANNEEERVAFESQVVLYDSLQLAHKCILNSFYGYVMRKGSRWYSMEMAAIVTFTGAEIIRAAHALAADIGKPLELDTDGIWTLLPKRFPQTYKFTYFTADGCENFKTFNYPCTLFNLKVHKVWANDQYLNYDIESHTFKRTTENFVFFEADGPYKAMILPASEKEGMTLKKRYAVFDMKNRLVELKGFEIKRRGELQLLKLFQEEVFPKFLEGSTRAEAYAAVAKVASRWLDFLDTRGQAADDMSEVFELIAESKFLSKPVKAQENFKSMGITTARRLTELLGDPTYINDKGIKCEYVVCANDEMEKTLRAVPVLLFDSPLEVQQLHLQRWLGISKAASADPRGFLDWAYYRQRLVIAILKIIIIPALLQGNSNPLPQVAPPEWLRRNIMTERTNQTRLSNFFFPSLPRRAADACSEDIENIQLRREAPSIPTEAEPPSVSFSSPGPAICTNSVKAVEINNEPVTSETWLLQCRKQWRCLRQKFQKARQHEKELLAVFHRLRAPTHETREKVSDTTTFSQKSIPQEIFERRRSDGSTLSRDFVEWIIVDVVEHPQHSGLLIFDVVLGHIPHRLFRIPVYHSRKIIVNARGDFNLDIPGVRVEEVQNAEMYLLPRRLRPHRLYTLHLSEEAFQEGRTSLRAAGDVVSVYGRSTPLDFDVLRSYGDTIRLRQADGSVQLMQVEHYGDVLCGPDSFDVIERRRDVLLEHTAAYPLSLQWVYITIVHEGPIDRPERVIVSLFQPPLSGAAKESLGATQRFLTGGSTILLAGGGSSVFRSEAAHFKAARRLFEHVAASVPKEAQPEFLGDPKILQEWSFEVPQTFATIEETLACLSRYVQRLIDISSAQLRPPLILYLSSSLPNFMVGNWADLSKRLNMQTHVCSLFHNTAFTASALPKFPKFNFTSEVYTRCVHELMSGAFLTEWCSVIAAAAQIPLLTTLRWSKSAMELQRLLLDLTLARGLHANHMISWESDQAVPDLGTPSLHPKSVTDYKLLSEEPVPSLVTPSCSWMVVFQLGFDNQFTLAAMSRLECLAERFLDPIRFAFTRAERKRAAAARKFGAMRQCYGNQKGNRSATTTIKEENKNPNKGHASLQSEAKDDSLPLRGDTGDDDDDMVPGELEEYFQHKSTIPPEVLVVLQVCLRHIQTRFATFQMSAGAPHRVPAARATACHFLVSTLRSLKAWLEDPQSLFYEPALLQASQFWTYRYLQALTQDVKKVSDNCVNPILATETTLVLTTPTLSQRAARSCLLLLMKGLRQMPLHDALDPQKCTLYRGFMLMDKDNWIGLQLGEHPALENHLTFLKCFPAPLRQLLQKAAQELIFGPLKAAGIRPSEEHSFTEDEEALQARIDEAAEKQVMPGSPMHTKWLRYLSDFEQIKEEWLKSGVLKQWIHTEKRILNAELESLDARRQIPWKQATGVQPFINQRYRYLNSVKQLNLDAFIEQRCWAIPTEPGMLQLQDVPLKTVSVVTDAYPTAQGRLARITPRLVESDLQIETARILHHFGTLSPHYWNLPAECREALLVAYCDTVRISSFTSALEYKPFFSPIILRHVICEHCDVSVSLNLMAASSPSTHRPSWACPECNAPMNNDVIEAKLAESVYETLEAAQAQDLICGKCRSLKQSHCTVYCGCGGTYIPRIPEGDFRLFFATIRSLVERYAAHFPWTLEILDQTDPFFSTPDAAA